MPSISKNKTRDFWARNTPEAYYRPVYGAHRACVTSHAASGFRFDENISDANLSGLQALYLPNVAIVNSAEIDILTRFVESGGTLLITGQSGTCDLTGNRSTLPAWERLVGARVKDIPDLVNQDYHVKLPPGHHLPQIRESFCRLRTNCHL